MQRSDPAGWATSGVTASQGVNGHEKARATANDLKVRPERLTLRGKRNLLGINSGQAVFSTPSFDGDALIADHQNEIVGSDGRRQAVYTRFQRRNFYIFLFHVLENVSIFVQLR